MTFSGAPARFVLPALLALACGSCKLLKKEEPALPDAAPVAEPAPVVVADAEPAPPPPAAEPEPAPQPAGTKPPAKVGDGGTPKSDAGTKDGGTSDAGGGSKSAACQSKCQGVLQICVTPSVTEAGLPSLGDPTKCREAFDACVAACK